MHFEKKEVLLLETLLREKVYRESNHLNDFIQNQSPNSLYYSHTLESMNNKLKELKALEKKMCVFFDNYEIMK